MDDGDAGLQRTDAQRLFGADPKGYADGRPGYPAVVYDLLERHCGLGPGARVLEVGPGAGQATVDLIARGAGRLVAVEPDGGLASLLRDRVGAVAEVIEAPFETAALGDELFDLACSATAWHWVDQEPGLRKLARHLAPGGSVGLWWTAFHDPEATDPLFDVLGPLLRSLPFPPVASKDGTSSGFAFDTEARATDLERAGFRDVEAHVVRSSLELDPPGARALFSTFSRVLSASAERREQVLSEIERIVAEQFDGRAERPCVTILHTARRD